MSSEVHFLDVGQAHATVAVNAGSALVVDCPRDGVEQAKALLSRLNLSHFDVVVTHQDMDHCEGVQGLLQRFGKPSTTLYINPVGRPKPEDKRYVRAVLEGILSEVDHLGASTAGAVADTVGNTGSISWSVLAPPHRQLLDAPLLANVVNRLSVVILVRIGSFTFLIPGDIDDKAAGELLDRSAQLSADVFLIPHHGARLKMIDRLLEAVDPKYAVISAGRRKTHPNVDTLTAVASHNCRLMCTQATRHCHPGDLADKHCAGTIVFDLRDNSLSVTPSPDDHRERIDQLESPACVQP